MKISENNKNILRGLGFILAITVFVYVIILVVEDYGNQQLKTMKEMKNTSEKKEAIANAKRDLAIAEIKSLRKTQDSLTSEIHKNNGLLNSLGNKYDKSLIEKNKYSNEKDFVPTDATDKQQLDYLSNYKYREY